jgi:hypothetical protein
MAPEEQVELLEESQGAAASWPPAAWGRRDGNLESVSYRFYRE